MSVLMPLVSLMRVHCPGGPEGTAPAPDTEPAATRTSASVSADRMAQSNALRFGVKEWYEAKTKMVW
jgi:hypothetical protein